jgi:OOP family OmpA-OmpF porin
VAPTTTTTVAPTTTTTVSTATSVALPLSGSSLPDGRPVSAVAIFDDDQIVLTGAVPTQQAADRLVLLASTFRLAPAPVVSNLTIDPSSPTSGGFRIVELNATDFASDSDFISIENARQMDRLVLLMTASPALTLHVVGHTDQRGDETHNLILSQRRAQVVVQYLVSHGIDPARLTTEPAGESNLVTTETTDDALALNSRIDFVLFGLLDG